VELESGATVTDGMNETVAWLADEHAELSRLVGDLDDDGWAILSRCEGWTIADVVLHLAQTNEMAIASVRGRMAEAITELAGGAAPVGSVDEGADLMVANQRGLPNRTIFERFAAGASQLVDVLRSQAPSKRVMWVAGELSVRTLATTRLAETWIHTGDVAEALGRSLPPTVRLRPIVRLAWRTLPYAFARAGRELAGPVSFELRGPQGQPWTFAPDAPALTTIRGEALDLCLVAARRASSPDTTLRGEGPDAQAVLELVRTYA